MWGFLGSALGFGASRVYLNPELPYFFRTYIIKEIIIRSPTKVGSGFLGAQV